MQKLINKYSFLFQVLLISVPIVAILISVGVGRYSLNLKKFFEVIWSVITNGKNSVSATDYSVVINMRLSRIVLALVCGGGLAVSGVALQSLFSNPLVSPDTLGGASGASFGAVLALLFKLNLAYVQSIALVFGLLAVYLTYSLSSVKGEQKIVMVILSGMVISSLFSALISLVKYLADTEEILPSITYWLMGSLYTSNWKSIIWGAPSIIVSSIIFILIRWKTNILSLSEDEAKTLGLNLKWIRVLVILLSAVITSSVVSMCGQIGWIGLLIPHICRMIFGSDNMKIIPASISFGAAFLLVIDTISRSISITELPVSILTAIIGAPIFILLLRRTGANS